MRSRRRSLLVAIALLVALAGVWLARRQDGDPRPAGTAARVAGDGGRDGAPRAAPRPRAPLGPVGPAEDWRSLRLTGAVVDSAGAAVAGAEVRLAGLAARTVVTDAHGGFVFPDLLGGTYFVAAFTPDAAAPPRLVRLRRDTPPVILRLAPSARLEVTVLAAGDQRPLAGATVEVRPGATYGDAPPWRGTTGADGRVAFAGLAPDSYGLAATAPGFRPADLPLQPQAGLRWEAILVLVPGAAVSGRVVDEAGAPVAGAVVTPFPAAVKGGLVPRPRRTAFDVVTDADGRFAVPALDPGEHLLQATHPEYLPGWSEPLTVDGRTPRTGLELRVARGGVVAGQVVTPAGEPAPFAVVRANALDHGVLGAGVLTTLSDGEGRFRIAGLPRSAVELVAEHDGGTSENYGFDLAAAAEATGAVLTLELDGVVSGVIVDADGTPIEGARVMCVGLPRGAIGLRPIVPEPTGADGQFACRGLAPGDYELTAMRPAPNNNQSPWTRSAGARADAGDTDVRIVIPGDGALAGQVVLADGSPCREFGASVDPGGAPRPFVTADGHFVLDGLAPRRYELRITGPGFLPKTLPVSVPEGGTIDVGTIHLDSR